MLTYSLLLLVEENFGSPSIDYQLCNKRFAGLYKWSYFTEI